MHKNVKNDNNFVIKKEDKKRANRNRHSMFQKVYQTLYHLLRVI